MVRKGFTLIELIMVIVILGIMAVMATDILASMYQNYLRSRSINYLHSETNLALDKISKQLSNRIKESVTVRIGTTGVPIPIEDTTDNHNVLEWINYSNESLNGLGHVTGLARSVPGWSGMIDLDNVETNNTANTLKTPGSNLNVAGNIIWELSNHEVDINDTNGGVALIFKGPKDRDMKKWGWAGTSSDREYVINVHRDTNDRIALDENITEAYEHYYLAHSAYALVPTEVKNGVFDLNLHYNYRPWLGESLADGQVATIARNVSLFRIRRFGETGYQLMFQLCIADASRSLTGTNDYGVCKERQLY